MVAEIDVLAALSACPGGDCGTGHSSDAAPCHPLEVTIYDPVDDTWPAPTAGAYDRSHGA